MLNRNPNFTVATMSCIEHNTNRKIALEVQLSESERSSDELKEAYETVPPSEPFGSWSPMLRTPTSSEQGPLDFELSPSLPLIASPTVIPTSPSLSLLKDQTENPHSLVTKLPNSHRNQKIPMLRNLSLTLPPLNWICPHHPPEPPSRHSNDTTNHLHLQSHRPFGCRGDSALWSCQERLHRWACLPYLSAKTILLLVATS